MNPYIIPGLERVKIPSKYFKMSYNMKSENVVKLVCETYGVTHDEIRHKTRARRIVDARHVLSWILVKKMGMTLSEVGKTFLGGRDHTTIINSIDRFNDIYDTDDEFREKADLLIEKITTWEESNTSSEK